MKYLLLLAFFLMYSIGTALGQPTGASTDVNATGAKRDPTASVQEAVEPANPNPAESALAPAEKLGEDDFVIQGGPSAALLKDFNGMFPDWDFYEEPSKEMKDKFAAQFPLWAVVMKRIEADDKKRMNAEDFFDESGFYPTAESHGDKPFENFLMDFLKYESKPSPQDEAAEASFDVKAEFQKLFPEWNGGAITPEMEAKFNAAFSARSFGSWNPLFYRDYYEGESSDDSDLTEGEPYGNFDEPYAEDEEPSAANVSGGAAKESSLQNTTQVQTAKS